MTCLMETSFICEKNVINMSENICSCGVQVDNFSLVQTLDLGLAWLIGPDSRVCTVAD